MQRAIVPLPVLQVTESDDAFLVCYSAEEMIPNK